MADPLRAGQPHNESFTTGTEQTASLGATAGQMVEEQQGYANYSQVKKRQVTSNSHSH